MIGGDVEEERVDEFGGESVDGRRWGWGCWVGHLEGDAAEYVVCVGSCKK